MNKGYIYCLIDPRDNAIRYIGKTESTIDRRFYCHLKDAKSNRTQCYSSRWIRKLLSLNLEPVVSEIDIVSVDEINFWERHYISLYKSWGFRLTNIAPGGEGGKLLQPRKPRPEWANNIRSENMKIFIPKLVEYNRRNGVYDMHKLRMKNNNPMYNYTKPVLQYDLNGNFIKEWKAAEYTGFSGSSIRGCVNGNLTHCGGYIWRYKTDNYPLKIEVPTKFKLEIPILQYDMNGSFVKEWKSYNQIEINLGFPRENVMRACDKNKICKGFAWRKKIDDNFPKKIDIIISKKATRLKII